MKCAAEDAAAVPRATTVAIAAGAPPWLYPPEPPFLPAESYPELGGRVRLGKHRNIVYPLFRDLARCLGLDRRRDGGPGWNPLGEVVRPGQNILVKPNLVRHVHLSGGDYQAVVTHASVVRCVLDYVARALEGRGQITVGDAPVQSADFDVILSRTGLREVCDDVAKTWQIPVRLVDFRLWSADLDDKHRLVNGTARAGDPSGYRWVDLGKGSLLEGISCHADRFRVTNYDPGPMERHHNANLHEYVVPQTLLDSDVVLNLPKLKTHRKVGLTAALKNIVGVNGHKDCLPHHRCGSPREGGDEYLNPSCLKRLRTRLIETIDRAPRAGINGLRRLLIRAADRLSRWIDRDSYQEGSWYGNDTLWRTVLDLNRVLIYAGRDGRMTETPQRRSFTIVDGIIAGEGEGPMEPDPRSCGLLVGGSNPAAVDAVLAMMVGFDYAKIPLISRAFQVEHWPIVDFRPDDIQIRSTDARFAGLKAGCPCTGLRFKAPHGWVGHIEPS